MPREVPVESMPRESLIQALAEQDALILQLRAELRSLEGFIVITTTSMQHVANRIERRRERRGGTI